MTESKKAYKSFNTSEYVPYTGNIVLENDMPPIGPFHAQSVGRVGVSGTNIWPHSMSDKEVESLHSMKIATSHDVIAGLHAEFESLKEEAACYRWLLDRIFIHDTQSVNGRPFITVLPKFQYLDEKSSVGSMGAEYRKELQDKHHFLIVWAMKNDK